MASFPARSSFNGELPHVRNSIALPPTGERVVWPSWRWRRGAVVEPAPRPPAPPERPSGSRCSRARTSSTGNSKPAFARPPPAHGYRIVLNSGDRDLAKQQSQIDDFIVQHVDAIVVCPVDSKGIGPAIERANAAKIPVFTADIAADGGQVVSHVASDNVAGGRLAAEYIAKRLGDKGDVGIIGEPDVQSTIDRESRVQGRRSRRIPTSTGGRPQRLGHPRPRAQSGRRHAAGAPAARRHLRHQRRVGARRAVQRAVAPRGQARDRRLRRRRRSADARLPATRSSRPTWRSSPR